MEITRFDDELVTNIMAGTPIIILTYKNTDKNSAFDMLKSLLRQVNKGLWFLNNGYGRDEDEEIDEDEISDDDWFVQHYSWKGRPKKIDPYYRVPKSKWKKVAGENRMECVLSITDVILKYFLPYIGKQEVLAFFANDFTDWVDIKIKLIEVARKYNKTILVLKDDFSPECFDDARVERWGFIADHWLPNEEELAENLKEYCEKKGFGKQIKCEFDDDDFNRLASLFIGSDFYEAQKKFMQFIIQQCYEMNRKSGATSFIVGKEAVDKLEAKMKEEFQRAENLHGLERIELKNFDKDSIAGLENLTQWLEITKKAFMLKEIDGIKHDKSSSPNRPRGVLLGGIPGCGKSLSAKCIAASFDMPLYQLDFGTVKSGCLGGSEQNLKEALAFASSRAPCILWIDEIEKGFVGGKGGTWADSTERQLLGMFLNYLQENKANVFIVATANDVQLLPAELIRKGRFDEIFFLDLPNKTERKQILKMYLKNLLEIDLSEEYAEEMVVATHGFTPADINITLVELKRKKDVGENPNISEKAIVKLFKESYSFLKTNPKRVAEIRAWGVKHARPASVSPSGKAEFQIAEDLKGLEEILLDDFDINSVAGLENLKTWLEIKKKVLSKEAELVSRGLSLPRGVLLGGIPGCGKSFSAKCIAASFGMPLYRLDFGTIQNKWIGESEQNLEDALNFASSKAPCVLFIDEIEKGFAARSDEPWTKKLLGMFLYYLQENKAKVFVVATANDVQLLPAELIRKGRFDEIFFLDLPNNAERKEILKIYLKKHLKIDLSEHFAKEIVPVTDGFTPSDIESVLREMAYEQIADDLDISEEFVIKRFMESTNFSKTSPERVKEIRSWGLEHAKAASKT